MSGGTVSGKKRARRRAGSAALKRRLGQRLVQTIPEVRATPPMGPDGVLSKKAEIVTKRMKGLVDSYEKALGPSESKRGKGAGVRTKLVSVLQRSRIMKRKRDIRRSLIKRAAKEALPTAKGIH